MTKAQQLYARAKNVIPGGVCSSTRYNIALGEPFYIKRSEGSKVYDYEGREFIDMNCAHGAALLGHNHPVIVEAMNKVVATGFICAAETEYQIELAEKLCKLIPCMERVRFCTSGSEATLHLIRLCRAYTKREKILRLEGHFHGYHEMIYIGGQPPMDKLAENRTRPYIESPGIPEVLRDLIVTAPFNDLEALHAAIAAHQGEIAALMLEPVNFNSGGIKPEPGYLEAIRKLTEEHGIVLFFDEIQSAFKKSPGGAQQDFGVTPDVCTIGKSLGGGMPISAFGGKAEIMGLYKPAGPVQHSGTFNAHLVQILPALAFVDEVVKPYFYEHLQKLEKRLHDGFDRIVKNLGVPVLFPHHGARYDMVMGLQQYPKHYSDLKGHDARRMLEFIRRAHQLGVYHHDYANGSSCHHGYSIRHTEADMDRVLEVTEAVLKEIY